MFDRSKETASESDCVGEFCRLTPGEPEPAAEASKRAAIKAAISGSLKQCGLSRVDADEVRRRVLLPERLRKAVAAAIANEDLNVQGFEKTEWNEEEEITEVPIFVFINPKSGGKQGPVLRQKLLDFVGEEQVII